MASNSRGTDGMVKSVTLVLKNPTWSLYE